MDGTYKIRSIGVMQRHIYEANNSRQQFCEESTYFSNTYDSLEQHYKFIQNKSNENEIDVAGKQKSWQNYTKILEKHLDPPQN